MKRIGKLLVVALLAVVTVEVVLRVYFAFLVGPSVLAYGTRFHHKQLMSGLNRSSYSDANGAEAKTYMQQMTKSQWNAKQTVIAHDNAAEGYTKYFPGQIRYDFDIETGERFAVTINSHGFRGQDYAVEKPDDTIRIITLGASSTFGYFDRDDETYPYYLERLLNDEYRGAKRIEVINFGIPHLRAAEIYQLFVHEALPLDPDVVTFYEGNNDSAKPRVPADRSVSMLTSAFRDGVGSRLIAVGLVESVLDGFREIELAPEDAEERQAMISGFIENVAKIGSECRARGITFIVGNQQRNSQLIEREDLHGVTYQDEVRMVKAMVSREHSLTMRENSFLIHATMMEELEDWAAADEVPFVDVIERLDQDRDVLVSWTHLSPKGNRMVAEAFSREIERQIAAR